MRIETLADKLAKQTGENQAKGNIIINAINDWPINTSSLKEFVSSVESKTGSPLYKERIEQFLDTPDFANNAWEAESLTQLLEIYQYYNSSLSITDILEDIEQHFK